jgi:hypothetical protein
LKEVVFLNLLFFLLIGFFLNKKRIPPFESIFLLLVVEFIFTCYVGVLQLNLEEWIISEKVSLYIIFRLNEVIVTPVLYIWCFNLLGNRKRNKRESIGISAVFISLIYSMEFLLLKWEVIVYKNWHVWQSVVTIAIIMVLSYLLLLPFRKLLSKEGVNV